MKTATMKVPVPNLPQRDLEQPSEVVISEQMRTLMHYVMTLEEFDPACMDDLLETVEAMSDEAIGLICQGDRQTLLDEITEIELSCENGWLLELLGEGIIR